MNIASGLDVTVENFVGRCVALLGITGSGKTNTAAVLIEELLGQGLPMTIIDIEGEYWGLKQKFDLLIAGKSEHAELAISPENAGALATASVTRGLSVILDLSEYTQEEMHTFLEEYFASLWEASSKVKQPYQIVLEEAHEFIPQGASTPLKQMLTRIALRGRKRGLGTIIMSQRSAKVEKDVLTQASLLFLHKVVHPTDMRVYNDLIPLPSKEVESMVGALHPGQVVVVSNHVPQVAQIRLRDTFHAGSTPTLGQVAQPELRHVDASLLQDLEKLIAASTPHSAKDEKRLEKKVKDLEAVLLEKDATIAKQVSQIEMLSRLSVSMQGGIKADVTMPETMQIAQANIDKATVNHAMMPTTAVQTATVVESVPVKKIAEVSANKPIPFNEKKVLALKSWLVKNSKPHHRKMLVLLHQEQKAMSVYELSSWLNISENTIRDHPPTAFMKRGLLARDRHGIYKSTLDAFIQTEFPGAKSAEVIQHLF